MALLVLSIPVMVVMVALAVVPLIVMSRAEHRSTAAAVRATTGSPPDPANELVPEPALSVAA